MKKFFAILLAVFLICSTAIVSFASETDTTETSVNKENYSKLAQYIMTKGEWVSASSSYRVKCDDRSSGNNTYCANIFLLGSDNIEIRYTGMSNSSTIGTMVTIKFQKNSNIANYTFELTMGASTGYVYGTVDMNDYYNNRNKDISYSSYKEASGNGTFFSPAVTMSDMRSLYDTSVEMALLMANNKIVKAIGLDFGDIFNNESSNNNTNNTDNDTDNSTDNDTDNDTGNNSGDDSYNTENGDEATPDSEEPTTPQPAQSGNSATSNQTSQSSPHAIQTGANTYAVVMIVMAAGLVLFATASLLKKKSN